MSRQTEEKKAAWKADDNGRSEGPGEMVSREDGVPRRGKAGWRDGRRILNSNITVRREDNSG